MSAAPGPVCADCWVARYGGDEPDMGDEGVVFEPGICDDCNRYAIVWRDAEVAVVAPMHKRPSSCFVCGLGPHEDGSLHMGGHRYFSNAAADAEIAAEAARHDARAVESQEARYVRQFRPY